MAMLERLGHLLGWICNIFAALFFAFAIYLQFFVRTLSVPFPYILNAFKAPYLSETAPELVVSAIAVAIFLIGRALRYIFAGPKQKQISETATDFYGHYRNIFC